MTLRNREREKADHRCDTKDRERGGMRMLRRIKGVTLRNRERE